MITDAMFQELVWKLLKLAGAFMAAMGVAGYLLFLGFWKKTVQPLVLAEIKSFADTAAERDRYREMIQKEVHSLTSSQDSVTTRDKAIESVVGNLRNRPEIVDARKKEITECIEDHVRRDDGLVHSELDRRFKQYKSDNDHRLDMFEERLLKEIAPLKESQERIVKIESMLHVVLTWGKLPFPKTDG